jgi:hypothetical protein
MEYRPRSTKTTEVPADAPPASLNCTANSANSGDSLLISSGCGHHLADPGEDTNSGGIIDSPSTEKPKRFPHRRVVRTTGNRTHVLVGDDRAFQRAADAALVIVVRHEVA